MVAELIEGALHLHPRPRLVTPAPVPRSATNRCRRSTGPRRPGRLVDPRRAGAAPRRRRPRPRSRRLAARADAGFPDAAWFELAPDWVCEVLSPGTRRLDLTDKRRIYAAAGVAHLWFVDPLARTLEAFALRDGAWTLIAALKDDEEVRVPPFDAIAFPLSVLWPD